MSYSILRRYTPPTCTLEIMANPSPLSRWAGQPVLKHVRFQLTLDDPKIPKDQWITLRGDRTQLEALREVVSTYVQNFLEQSQSHLSAAEMTSRGEAIAIAPSATASENALALAASNGKGLSLKPRGLLNHDLVLGSLATSETNGTVHLSALQLFDLANALDDYAADAVALPNLSQSRWSMPASLNWGQLAATGLVVIGLSASVAKIIDSSMKPASVKETGSDQPIATQPSSPAASNSIPPIASNQKLPPPPPIGSTVPVSPGLPSFPLPSPSASTSGAQSSAKTATVNPAPNARLQKQAGGNQIAMVPNNSLPSAAKSRSQPVPPMPKPLSMQREFANAPQLSQAAGSAARAANDSASPAETGTAFDTIPQVAEARQYFQQRWSPPSGLTQTLEYTLLVNADGSIQRAVPLGQAAGDYVDRTGIPLAGEPFVSAISGGRNAKIRLVLSSDGTVKTFLEGFYK